MEGPTSPAQLGPRTPPPASGGSSAPRHRASFWVAAFNGLSGTHLLWNAFIEVVLLTSERDCGNDCAEALGATLLWVIGELLFAPPLLVSTGVVIGDRDRRRFGNIWFGLSALAMTFCSWAITVVIARAT